MVDAGAIVGIIIAVILIIVLLILWNTIYIVRQAEAIIIERFGRFHRVLKPGLNCVAPLVDAPRNFTWRKVYIDVDKKMVDTVTTGHRVDLRESLYAFPRIEVFSKDTVLLEVAAVMFYRVVDARRAVYDVVDLAQAVSDTAQSQMKRIFGGMSFAEALQSQTLINEMMRRGVADTYSKWGLQVERVEVQDLRPKATSDTATAMKKQMISERQRRSEFIQAEGNKAAMKLRSEGLKIVKTNLGIAEQEGTRKRSEGDATAKIELARAEKVALDTIAESVEADGCGQTDYMVAKRYQELLRTVPAARDKTTYIPFEASSISGLIGRLPDVYGRGSSAAASAPIATATGVAGAAGAATLRGAAGGAARTGFAPAASPAPFSELD